MTNLNITASLVESLKHATNIEAEAKAERERLERMLASVKGTRPDVSKQARAAIVQAPRSLPEQAEAVLRQHVVMTEAQIAKALGITPGATQRLCGTLAREHKLYNLSTEEHPRWTWRIGEQATPSELTAHVLALISAAPLTLRQLEAATNAPRNRVNGSLIQIQRDPALRRRLVNLGNARVHVHFMQPPRGR